MRDEGGFAAGADAEVLFFAGTDALVNGKLEAAVSSLKRAVFLSPAFAEAHANLALALEKQGKLDDALSHYRRSLQLDASIARTHLNVGALLTKQKQLGEAEAACLNALRLQPRAAAAWSNLGVLYACMQREAEAEQCYRSALGFDPAYANAAFNLSYLLLRQGRYAEGWHHFEARDWYRALEERMQCPRWRGEDLSGKSILLGCEAGYGDMIQFVRYAVELKRRGASRTGVLAPPLLRRLFGFALGVDDVVAFESGWSGSRFDYWTPMLSAPQGCGTVVDSIPAPIPYFHVPGELRSYWKQRMPEGYRVGLAWKGNPKFENDSDRSLPSLDVLAPLNTCPGIRFVSLQKGAGEDCVGRPCFPLLDVMDQVSDFADTAAIIGNLDLVITVDTVVAHLAGALGTPCWVMLPQYKADWRWLREREDSPWYPKSMRLFRQRTTADWRDVVERMVAELGAEKRRAIGERA